MTVTCQFVSAVSASPSVRLELGFGPLAAVREGSDFRFPELSRSVSSTLMRDGAHLAGSAYGLRTLVIRLLVDRDNPDLVAESMQALFREIDRPTNILKWQPNTSRPVFFQTFRSSPEDAVEYVSDGGRQFVKISLLAKHYAIGLKETPVSAQTLNTDPAGAGNPCFFDITSPKGDLPAPAIIKAPASTSSHTSLFAVRRRGTVGNVPFLKQVESFTMGTDTTVLANDPVFSGAGSNYARCTFSTVTGMATRAHLTVAAFATASVDLRGTYRVFCRYRKNTAGDGVLMRLAWGTDANPGAFVNPSVTLPSVSTICYADLGEVNIPYGVDPRYDGLSGVELVHKGIRPAIQLQRTSGATTVDLDHLLFVPADESLGYTTFPAADSGTYWFLDADDDSNHQRDASDEVIPNEPPSGPTGGYPWLQPGQTNRLYIVRNMGPGGTTSLTTITNWSVSYYPRYLWVQP